MFSWIVANTLVVLLLLVFAHVFIGVRFTGTPLSSDLSVENNYRYISAADGREWWVVYQWPWDSTFSGEVRDVSTWEDYRVPFMSHDILVTSGEFADPEVVRTSVQDHIFIFRYWGQRPDGQIYPLHTFPASKEVLEDLENIQSGDNVRITGREILLIKFYNALGNPIGHLTDNGCNTILVTKVEIIAEEMAGR